MINLVKKFKLMERLDAGFTNITDSGLERMLSEAKNLKYLRVNWARNLTKEQLEGLRIEYPDLTLRIIYEEDYYSLDSDDY